MRLLIIGLIMTWSAPTALASEIVDLRIGSHADFTRVVFELDSPTGYRIERSSPRPGTWELVITVDASSIPRKVQSDEALIGLVQITPRGNRSVAQIQLKRGGLRLKEMILANPPRIVLDVLAPVSAKPPGPKVVAKSEAVKKEATKPAAREPLVVAKPAEKPVPQPVAQPVAKVQPQKPVPAPKRVAKAEPPKPVPAAQPVVEPAPAASTVAKSAARSEDKSRRAPGFSPASPPKVVPGTKPEPVGEPSEGGVATMGVDKPAAKSLAARSPKPKPQKMAREIPKARVAESESGISTTTIAALLVGVVVLAGGAFFWRRRSMGGSDADEGQDVGGVGNNPFSGFASSDSDQPALSLGGGGGLRAASEFETGGIEEDPDAKEESAPAPHTEMTSLELDAEQTLVSGMSQSNTQLTGGSQGVQGSMNVTPEFEQRMAGLESKLNDVSEARERLERQVAAQTEELRVQRAAIARTQRAVRNMSRGDDDGPTEPTPRDSQ